VLIRAINSVLNQTYKSLEILVVDDNANDLSIRDTVRRIVESYENTGKVFFWENNITKGCSAARNLGIKKAKGRYIAFLDDDDVYAPTKIEKQLALFQVSSHNPLAMVYCYGRILFPNGSMEQESTDEPGSPIENHMKNNIAGTSFWLCKKDILLEIGGFDNIASHNDGIVILKMLVAGYKVDLVRESLVDYYVHSATNGITGVTWKNIEADEQYFAICNCHFHLLTKKAITNVITHYYEDRVWNLIVLGDFKRCKADIRYLLGNYPFRIETYCSIMRLLFKRRVIKKEEKRLQQKGISN
jgi:glycosyltransferase involved in cell wall biosynthesis